MKQKIYKKNIKKIVFMVIMILLSNAITYCIVSDRYRNDHVTDIHAMDSIKIEKNTVVKKTSFSIDSEKAEGIENIVIIAHPDDETFWGGDFITKEKCLILCITNSNNMIRKKEFFDVMKETGNYGIMLSYPDNPNHIISNWSDVKSSIYSDLEYLINYKLWKKIITHNPEGEYGHIHHKFTNMMVTNICVEAKKTDSLFYFGKYKKKENISKDKVLLTKEEIKNKIELMEMYTSQGKSYQAFKHMAGYEKFIAYKDWYFG